jgi:hypothetical protein
MIHAYEDKFWNMLVQWDPLDAVGAVELTAQMEDLWRQCTAGPAVPDLIMVAPRPTRTRYVRVPETLLVDLNVPYRCWTKQWVYDRFLTRMWWIDKRCLKRYQRRARK